MFSSELLTSIGVFQPVWTGIGIFRQVLPGIGISRRVFNRCLSFPACFIRICWFPDKILVVFNFFQPGQEFTALFWQFTNTVLTRAGRFCSFSNIFSCVSVNKGIFWLVQTFFQPLLLCFRPV
jgi:hypothetical protein